MITTTHPDLKNDVSLTLEIRGFRITPTTLTSNNEGITHIMFYKERFIRNDFGTSLIFEKFKEQTSHFLKK